jgi:transposase
MRFVAVKSQEQQAAGLVFRTRDLLVRQRTQLINAIRGHLTEYGWVAPKGPSHVAMLADLIEEEEMANSLPAAARAMFRVMLDLLTGLSTQPVVGARTRCWLHGELVTERLPSRCDLRREQTRSASHCDRR